jgi:transposase
MEKRRQYDISFKEEAVKLAIETNTSKAADSLGVPMHTLRNWVESARKRPDSPFIGSGHKYIPAQDAEKVALLKENKELKRANDILKEALAFFAVSQKK